MIAPEVILVSHTHWDREWYRPFESFRARLVDTVDLVLDQLAADPGWSFLLDGQAVVVEDYLEVRPHRRAELEAACRSGRVAIGPWYVQPDSLLPSGETHVRNLLEGRRVGGALGPVSTVGYTPDSFGHPAQMPHLFAGFGIGSFIYWRGNGAEIDRLPPVWRWVAPSGDGVTACLLAEGYFAAAYLGADASVAAERLERLVTKLAHPDSPAVLLMNGIDHAPPDPNTGGAVAGLQDATGWTVRRGLLEDFVSALGERQRPEFTGELVGGRLTNLLPGVWSTRTYLKRWNRTAETALLGWAEPFVALAGARVTDERPSIRRAWRTMLVNQAHDSICGCSTDVVHDQMVARYQSAIGLADETTSRVLERLSGTGPRREVEWHDGVDVAVWNSSPHARTDVVRFALDAHPLFMIGSPEDEIHPIVLASLTAQGMTVDGSPARVVSVDEPGRVRLVPGQPVWDVEFVARDVPAYGWRRYRLATGPRVSEDTDHATVIGAGDLQVEVAPDGTMALRHGDRVWDGLLGVEDGGDRGDTYDADVVDAARLVPGSVEITRSRHANGVHELTVVRQFDIPVAMTPDRTRREDETKPVTLTTVARVVPGVDRVDVDVAVDNTARDHRLRLLFPCGASEITARTTFDGATRCNQLVDDSTWMQPKGCTFCVQGAIRAGGMTIGAPDLREAELLDDGTVALTLVRAVGWLSQMDLHSRPIPAGPGMPTPGAQCLGRFATTIRLWPGDVPEGEVDAAERGLRAVAAGPRPLVPEGQPQMILAPATLSISAVKLAESGEGVVIRVLNVSDVGEDATLDFADPVASAAPVRLDETAIDGTVVVDGTSVTFPVGAHATATIVVRFA